MGGAAGRREPLVAMEEQVFGLTKGDELEAVEDEATAGANGGEMGLDGGRIDGVRGFSGEAEEDGAVGAVADAGEGE